MGLFSVDLQLKQIVQSVSGAVFAELSSAVIALDPEVLLVVLLAAAFSISPGACYLL